MIIYMIQTLELISKQDNAKEVLDAIYANAEAKITQQGSKYLCIL